MTLMLFLSFEGEISLKSDTKMISVNQQTENFSLTFMLFYSNFEGVISLKYLKHVFIDFHESNERNSPIIRALKIPRSQNVIGVVSAMHECVISRYDLSIGSNINTEP
jgi:hypothetical protein